MRGDIAVRLLNHACLAVDDGQAMLLTDPWFFGRAFADSWALRAPTVLDGTDLGRVRWIWISHEHPDHLHFPTLRWLRAQIAGPVEVLYGGVSVAPVRSAVESMGFAFRPLQDRRKTLVGTRIALTPYLSGHDSAAVIEAGSRVLFNQNDCRLGPRALQEVRASVPRIDAWFCQFSLAGWHANAEDISGLEAARREHIDRIGRWQRMLRPSLFVPFASFANFCRPTNAWMNRWSVSVHEVLASWPMLSSQCLFSGDSLRFDEQGGDDAAVHAWENAGREPVDLVPHAQVCDASLLALAENLLREAADAVPQPLRPAPFRIALEAERALELDHRSGRARIVELDGEPCVAQAPSDLVAGFLKHPYGADTLHISACARVYDPVRWRHVLQFRVALHKFAEARLRRQRWASCAAEALRAVVAPHWAEVREAIG